MSVLKKSLKKFGKNYKVSKNITLKELACKDGTDIVLYDTDTVSYVQSGRDYFKKPVIISSAYRTKKYNSEIGGSGNSYHIKGKAIDLKYNKIDPICACQYFQLLGAKGILYYNNKNNGNFTHCDSRTTTAYILYLMDETIKISSFLPSLSANSKNSLFVKALELRLKAEGYWKGETEGIKFSEALKKSVIKFQKAEGLVVDGIVGLKTWRRLYS